VLLQVRSDGIADDNQKQESMMLLGTLAFAVVILAQFLAVIVMQSARRNSGSMGGPRAGVRARPPVPARTVVKLQAQRATIFR
jgi:hypothetical protein